MRVKTSGILLFGAPPPKWLLEESLREDLDLCHCEEGTLPTDCPGERMPGEFEARIYKGEIDYRAGRGWCEPDGTGTSMGDGPRRLLKQG